MEVGATPADLLPIRDYEGGATTVAQPTSKFTEVLALIAVHEVSQTRTVFGLLGSS